MELLNLNKTQKKDILKPMYKNNIEKFINFGDKDILQNTKTHDNYINLLLEFLEDKKFVTNIYQKLILNQKVKDIYNYLLYKDNKILTSKAKELFELKLEDKRVKEYYDTKVEFLDNEYNLIQRTVTKNWRGDYDILQLDEQFIDILKLIFPRPDDYELISLSSVNKTSYTYNNTQGVLQFINIIEQMSKNNLVEFGKTNEKPLSKTLNILKSTSGIVEFYSEKKLDTLATDMLTRSFYFYYLKIKKFKEKEQDSLKEFLKLQLDNQLDFFISRVFASHLKKVRYDFYYSSQNELFNTAKLIINNLISKDWVDIQNIINFTIYRKLSLNIESPYKTKDYCIESTNKMIMGEDYYDEIYYEPMVKALMFYMGALGVIELLYDEPISPYQKDEIFSKDSKRISPWDGLKYVKITDLGLYLLDINKTYESKKIQKKKSNIKFDEYKPIITIDKTDTITIAKLEPFVEKYDNRYILSYSKIFRDCKSYKSLLAKIDTFYKIFDTTLPKIFDEYFEEIKENANMLKKDLSLISIELKNNKKLLHLFMTNKKLQELTIKASGYRVLVSKENIPKLSKIIKENGFFIEF